MEVMLQGADGGPSDKDALLKMLGEELMSEKQCIPGISGARNASGIAL